MYDFPVFGSEFGRLTASGQIITVYKDKTQSILTDLDFFFLMKIEPKLMVVGNTIVVVGLTITLLTVIKTPPDASDGLRTAYAHIRAIWIALVWLAYIFVTYTLCKETKTTKRRKKK
jgi:hypothetical protein